MTLKSSDHVEKILEIINAGTWAQDAIWEKNKDDEDYVEIPLPDRSYSSGGFIVIERGRSEIKSTGLKLYNNQDEMWKGMLKHWPRFPLKKSHWKRTSRKKDGVYVVRNFELFAHNITAVTFEKDDEIDKIDFYIQNRWDETLKTYPIVLLYAWVKNI